MEECANNLSSTVQMLDKCLTENIETTEENIKKILKHDMLINDLDERLATARTELEETEDMLREANSEIVKLKAQIAITMAIALLSFALNFFI